MKTITIFLLMLYFSNSLAASKFKQHKFSIGVYESSLKDSDIRRLGDLRPIWFRASTKASHGLMINYERNLWHSGQYFSLDAGIALARWQSISNDIEIASIYLNGKLWLYQSSSFNPYLSYTVAGPSYMSNQSFANKNLGSKFIFLDYFGIGAQIGNKQNISLEAKFLHYSNGGLYSINPGFDVPVVLTVSWLF